MFEGVFGFFVMFFEDLSLRWEDVVGEFGNLEWIDIEFRLFFFREDVGSNLFGGRICFFLFFGILIGGLGFDFCFWIMLIVDKGFILGGWSVLVDELGIFLLEIFFWNVRIFCFSVVNCNIR